MAHRLRRCDFPLAYRTLASRSVVLESMARVVARLFNLFFPSDCQLCGLPLDNVSRIPVCKSCLRLPEPMVAEYECSQCRAAFLNDFPLRPDGRCALCRAGITAFQSAFSYGSYDGSLGKLVHLLKYRRVRPLAKPLGELLVRALPRTERFDVLVPMPLHWTRLISRGFNQAESLAIEVGRRTGVPVANALRRRKRTLVQAGLTAAQRRRNVQGAFTARDASTVQGKRVLLIDDVMTTGATAAAAARILVRAGAARVTVLTVARADRRAPLTVAKSSSFSKAAGGAA